MIPPGLGDKPELDLSRRIPVTNMVGQGVSRAELTLARKIQIGPALHWVVRPLVLGEHVRRGVSNQRFVVDAW